jgi:protein involved in polysaccharide export with SLBB domain
VPKGPVKKISETVSPLPINSTLLLTTITTAGLKQLDDAPPTKLSDIGSNAGAPTRKETEFSEVAIYRVGVGDALDVRVSGSPPGTPTLFTISASGVLDHPVLPEPLKVIGLTTDEVSESLSNELKRLALSEKKVLVAVAEYNSHTILISGLVNEPGTKSLRREAIPLYVVLAEAQPFAEAGRATILSRDGKTTNVGLLSPEANSFLIRRGDVVLVQAKPELFFYIGGEVKEPGEKPFRQGLKLTQAILAAGGSTRVSKEVLVAREGSHGMLELSVYKLGDIHSGKLPDPTIQPGDRITVVP